MVYLESPPRSPRSSDFVPAVPASEEVLNPESKAQHSRVERLCRAPRTVTLRVLPRARVEDRRRERIVRRIVSVSMKKNRWEKTIGIGNAKAAEELQRSRGDQHCFCTKE